MGGSISESGGLSSGYLRQHIEDIEDNLGSLISLILVLSGGQDYEPHQIERFNLR